MKKPKKILSALPRGYESGYKLIHAAGVSILKKAGLPSLIFTKTGWRELAL